MNFNFLKPKKENLINYVVFGSFFILISFFDVFANNYLNYNFTGFLPDKLNYLAPLFIGAIGLYYIRIEFIECFQFTKRCIVWVGSS